MTNASTHDAQTCAPTRNAAVPMISAIRSFVIAEGDYPTSKLLRLTTRAAVSGAGSDDIL